MCVCLLTFPYTDFLLYFLAPINKLTPRRKKIVAHFVATLSATFGWLPPEVCRVRLPSFDLAKRENIGYFSFEKGVKISR